MIHKNVVTDFSPKESMPSIDTTAYIHPLAAVIGNVTIGRRVMVAPFAAIRGDEGQPIRVDDEANVQDGVVLHGLETELKGRPVEKNLVEADGKHYSVYVGKRVSLAHQVQIHGPARVGDDSFVGMQTLVFKSSVGKNCVVEPGCILMGVSVPDGRYVPAGTYLPSGTLTPMRMQPGSTTQFFPTDDLKTRVCMPTKLSSPTRAGPCI